MTKLITIITSAYRCEPYLLGYLENMTQLTNRGQVTVILIINDPTSYEKELSHSFQTQYPDLFHVQYTNRETIGASLNRGLQAAETPYVAYADVDDRRPFDAFQRQLTTLENSQDAQFTYGDFIAVKKQKDTHGRYVKTPEFNFDDFTRSSCVGPGHFFRKSLLDRIGYYDEQLRSGADFEFQVRAAFNCCFKKTPGIVAYYLLDNRLPSASKTPWQKIDACLISLRYGIYDKLNYDYVAYTTPYDISHVHSLGNRIPVNLLIPSYNISMEQRHSKWSQLGIKNYLKEKRLFWKLFNLPKRILQKVQRDGILETAQTAHRYLSREK